MTREEAITALGDRNNLLWGMSKEEKKYYSEALDMAILALSENKGEWIYLDECANSGYYCSICHKKLVKDGWSDTVKKIKFCPNCGVDMRKAEKPETCKGCLEPCIMYESDMRACKKKVKAESEE